MMKRYILCFMLTITAGILTDDTSVAADASGQPAATAESTPVLKKYFVEQARVLCERIGKSSPDNHDKPRDTLVAQLIKQIPELHANISLGATEENAKGWKTYLQTDELLKTLKSPKPDLAVMEKSLDALKSGEPGLENAMFTPVRTTLTELVSLSRITLKDAKAREEDGKYVAELSRKLPGLLETLANKYDAELAESITLTLEDLKYYRPVSNDVRQLVNLVSAYFPVPNFVMSASSRLWVDGPVRNVSEDFPINDIIRGASVSGQGRATGILSVALVPNEATAELSLKLATNFQSTTVASRDGAQVYSTSSGVVEARKSLFFGKDIVTSPATAFGSFQSQITGINSGRRAMGQGIAEQRVMEEKPYSEMESKQKMEYRIASRLDQDVNAQVGELNKSLRERFVTPLEKQEYFPRAIVSRSTAQRLYWSALVANDVQLGLPQTSRGEKDDDMTKDLSFMVHESCPNNAAFFAFAGRRVSDHEVTNNIVSFFPELKQNEKKTKTPEKESGKKEKTPDKSQAAVTNTAKESDKTESPLWLSFTGDLPIITKFEKDQIVISMRIDQFEKDDRTYPGLNVNIVYVLTKGAGGHFVFQKKSTEVMPAGIKKGQVIPARYQAIRSMVLKRLEEQLDKEIAVKPIDTSKMGDNGKNAQMIRKGTLVPAKLTAKDGWLLVEYEFAKNGK